jgi:UDP-glucose 4-epimerase
MAQQQLTVAVTGPTGEIGIAFIEALERHPDVGRVLAMARRPFEPADHGWTKTEYRRGDILDRAAVDGLVAGVDAVVHLAFIVVQASAGSYDVNIEGSRNVFDATVAAGVPRLVYTSSVAAYGYGGADGLLTEDLEPKGTEQHAYSQQKAAVEKVLAESMAGATDTRAWVFRPCIVAGPRAPALLDQLPYVRLEPLVPGPVRSLLSAIPGVRPVLPDHGVPFQLVHHDDVAAALVAAVAGDAEPGTYNLAAAGEVTSSDLAAALGWHSVPIPRASVTLGAKVLAHVPGLSNEAGWLEALRTPMLMDTTRARSKLGWAPAYDARQTLTALVEGRSAGG